MEKNNDNYRNSFNDAEAIKEYRKQLKNIKRLAKEIKEKPKNKSLKSKKGEYMEVKLYKKDGKVIKVELNGG